MVTLAHQIETFARTDRTKALKPLDSFLKKIRKPRRRPDESERVAAMLDRMISRQQKANPDGSK